MHLKIMDVIALIISHLKCIPLKFASTNKYTFASDLKVLVESGSTY